MKSEDITRVAEAAAYLESLNDFKNTSDFPAEEFKTISLTVQARSNIRWDHKLKTTVTTEVPLGIVKAMVDSEIFRVKQTMRNWGVSFPGDNAPATEGSK